MNEILERLAELSEPECINEPLPQAALLSDGVPITDYQLMLPDGNAYMTRFTIQCEFSLTHVSVRFANTAPVIKPLAEHYALLPSDVFTLRLLK